MTVAVPIAPSAVRDDFEPSSEIVMIPNASSGSTSVARGLHFSQANSGVTAAIVIAPTPAKMMGVDEPPASANCCAFASPPRIVMTPPTANTYAA